MVCFNFRASKVLGGLEYCLDIAHFCSPIFSCCSDLVLFLIYNVKTPTEDRTCAFFFFAFVCFDLLYQLTF